MNRIASQLGVVAFAVIATGVALERTGVMSQLQFDLVFAAAVGTAAFGFMMRLRCDALRAAILTLAIVGLAVAARMADPDIRLAPYFAIMLVNGFVAYIFARGLLPGREPLILQVIRLAGSGPEGSPAFRRFAYGQCRLWSGFAFLTALGGLGAMIFPALRPAAEMSIAALIAVQIFWFVQSHRYANRRYGRPETWRETLRAFSRPAIWAGLEI